MKLFNRIKVDQLGLRLEGTSESKRSASFLTTLIGELETDLKNGKPPTEGAVIAKIKKVISNNKETISLIDTNKAAIFISENEVLGWYLPKQLTEAELYHIMGVLAATNIGQIMGHLKENYAGQYDGKVASKVAKGFINNGL